MHRHHQERRSKNFSYENYSRIKRISAFYNKLICNVKLRMTVLRERAEKSRGVPSELFGAITGFLSDIFGTFQGKNEPRFYM